jgi:hypothetical protein
MLLQGKEGPRRFRVLKNKYESEGEDYEESNE